jgi:hypothetical protein
MRNMKTGQVKKPPIGLKPLWIHEEERYKDIYKAMMRYRRAKLIIPKEWVVEADELAISIFRRRWPGR